MSTKRPNECVCWCPQCKEGDAIPELGHCEYCFITLNKKKVKRHGKQN